MGIWERPVTEPGRYLPGSTKGAESFEEMKNIPMALRERIGEEYSTGALHPSLVQVSKIDGTRKYLFELEDGNAIESVFMK